MQEKYIKINNLQVSEKLSNFVNDELLKNTNVSVENFWLGLEKTLDELAPKNKELIKFREELQKKIDDWHIKNKGNKKPVVGFIAGETAPKGRKMGHAGAIIGGKDDTASAKKRIMRESGVNVVDSPADIGKTVNEILK